MGAFTSKLAQRLRDGLAKNSGAALVGFAPSPAINGVIDSAVQQVLSERISITRFMTLAQIVDAQACLGALPLTAAFNAAIAYANSKAGNDRANIKGTTILIPDGWYNLPAALNPVTVSSVFIVGESPGGAVLRLASGGDAFTFGDPTGARSPVGGGIRGVKIEYPAGPTGTATVMKVDNGFSMSMQDCFLENVGTLVSLGATAGRVCGGFTLKGIKGSFANLGYGAIKLNYGAGLFMSDIAVFVRGVLNPAIPAFTGSVAGSVLTVSAITGTPLQVGAMIHAAGVAPGTSIASFGTGAGGVGTYNLSAAPGAVASEQMTASGVMTTTLGTNFIDAKVGFWDTVQSTNVIAERFDVSLNIVAGAGMVYQNFFFTNTIMDYHRRWCVYAESLAGGVVSTVVFDDSSWFVSWETDAIKLHGAGYNDDHSIRGKVVMAGGAGLNYALPNAKACNFNGIQINAANRMGVYAAAMLFAGGSRGFSVVGAGGNVDTAAVGLPWRAGFGVQVGADCDNYIVSGCNFGGSVAAFNLIANTTASANRKVHGNIGANYSGVQALAMPASGARVTNMSATVWGLDFFGGTITGGYDKSNIGYPGALQYVHMRLEPGESFACGYSVAPTVIRFIEA